MPLPVVGATRPWADPEQVAVNRLPMHPDLPRPAGARRPLDGDWRFRLFETPDAVPAGAVTGPTPAPGRGWTTVAVPGNWTMQVDGDRPVYTNIQMPFDGPPPRLPERNPTGVHRRSFTVPAAWRRRRTVLHVAGAESVHAVYLNDAFVGYGTDSRLPSEYDLTPHLRAGENHLAVVVVRWSAQSYVEDQDQWWMAGLHRSVWLESRPSPAVGDVSVRADWDPDAGRGALAVRTVLDLGGRPAAGHRVRTWMETLDGRRIGARREGPVPAVDAAPYVFAGHHVDAAWDGLRVRPWSAETPERYRVRVELVGPSGAVVDETSQLVGFRRVEVRDRQLLVNGRPVWIFGVNRHDHHPDRGKAVTVDDMRADLVTMRRHNVTAVRTSHYPNDSAFLDLCDELGFYVVAEADIESHGYNDSLCHDARYRATWLERGARMVQRDRNHPCVILWSLGNESGYGANHDALAGWIRRVDPTRPLHYEDALRVEGWVDGGRRVTDVVCPMYPTIDAIVRYGREGRGDRPLIMCEYSHAMGNSNGSLADYWAAITTTPGLQGGFLWEWKDHTLRQALPDGTTRLAFGGQFGEERHDGNFVADGLVSSELVPHPAMREVAWVHRPVTVERARSGLRVANRRSFTGLDDLEARWELAVDGDVVAQGRLRVPAVAPHTSVVVPWPCERPVGAADVTFTVRWTTRRDAWFAPRGHLVAWDQIVVRERTQARRPPPAPTRVPVPLRSGPALNLWRAPVDNDGFKLMPELAERLRVGGLALLAWQAAGVDRRPADELVGHALTVTEDAAGTVYRHVVDVPEPLADLPRVGALLTLPAGFDRVRWFGRGPHENYPDRAAAAMLGVWEGPLDGSPHVVPQEYGLRTGCRWIELIDASSGTVVRIEAVEPVALAFSATRHTPDDLYRAAHEHELRPRDEVVVCLDVAHRGVGTASCGPDVLPPYRLAAGRYEFAYRVRARRLP